MFFSNSILLGLPYGSRKAKLTTGQQIDIPSTIRLHSHNEIVKLYNHYIDEMHIPGDYKLSKATLFRILSTCSAHKNKALHCLDYFISDCHQVIKIFKFQMETVAKNRRIYPTSIFGKFLKIMKNLQKATNFMKNYGKYFSQRYIFEVVACPNFSLFSKNRKLT